MRSVSGNMVKSHLRIALLLNESQVPKWVGKLTEELGAAEHFLVAVLVSAGPTRATGKPSVAGLPRALFGKAAKLIGREAIAVGEMDPPSRRIELLPGEDGRVVQSQIDELSSLDLDVIVQPISGPKERGLESLARYGLWSFRYTDDSTLGACEIHLFNLLSGATSELALVSSRGENLPEEMLFRCRYAPHPLSLQKNVALDADRRRRILVRTLNNVPNHVLAKQSDQESSSTPQMRPKRILAATARLLARGFAHAIRKRAYRSQWLLGFYNPTESGPITIIRPPRGLNYGDPFLFEHSGQTYVFFEVWKDGERGSIYAAEIGPEGLREEPRLVLVKPYHLSYPFVFGWDGGIYLMPETEQNKTLEVYRAVEFPYRWELYSTPMSGVSAVDSTLVQHGGKFFLFTTGLGGREAEIAELSIFSSETPFGPWHPHARNPVICDVRTARQAGAFFYQSGQLVRVAQDCSGPYGRAIVLKRVDQLSETEFSETEIGTISAEWMPDARATHTLNQLGTIGVIDVRVEVPWFRAPFSGMPKLSPTLQVFCNRYEDTIRFDKSPSTLSTKKKMPGSAAFGPPQMAAPEREKR